MITHPLIFVVGPTGVGKSAWALELAQSSNGAILNCDSVQAYQGLDIGTAKPTAEEQNLVPHFLFDVMKAGEVMTAGDYRRMALQILEAELSKRPVYAVGGSGFYIQALEKGMFEVEKIDAIKEAALRDRLEKQTQKQCYEQLKKLDPETAEELNPNDSYRVQRALIIVLGLGKRLSDLKRQFKPQKLPYPLIKVGLNMDRKQLRVRIETRARSMLEHGLIHEVEGLLKKDLKNWPILQSVGYKQVMMVLQGQLPEAQLLEEITLRTFQLSKRQMTWFQRDKDIRWFDAKSEQDAPLAKEWLLGELDSRCSPHE